MKVSVNTAVFLDDMQNGVSQYECLSKLVNKPIQDIEVRGEFFKDDTQNAELNSIDQLCRSQQWNFYYSIPEELFTDGKLNENIFDYLKLAEANSIKGLKISLGSFKTLEGVDTDRLSAALKMSQVKVTVENQPNENGLLAQFVKNLACLLDVVPELGYTFDSGNWYWIDESPENAFEELQKYITIFHLKDIKDRDTVMLGEGTTNWEKLLHGLKADTPVFLEYAIDESQIDQEIEKVNSNLD